MTSDIGEYMISTSNNAQALVTEVNKLIASGWQPHGSVSTWPDGRMTMFGQPMIRLRVFIDAVPTPP
jgi:hypothetical protein